MVSERTLREPIQARAQKTRAALLAAAEREFSEHGYAQTTAKSIAARAAVATGSFYQYFHDKDAALHELARARTSALATRVRSLRHPHRDAAAALAALRGVIEAVLEYHRADVGLHAVLTERRHADAALDGIERASERRFVAHIAVSLDDFRYAGDRKALAFVIFALIEGAVHSHVLGTRTLSDRRFTAALIDAMVTLVRAGLPNERGGRHGTSHSRAS
jgi:AcrR family transcriptional regulator